MHLTHLTVLFFLCSSQGRCWQSVTYTYVVGSFFFLLFLVELKYWRKSMLVISFEQLSHFDFFSHTHVSNSQALAFSLTVHIHKLTQSALTTQSVDYGYMFAQEQMDKAVIKFDLNANLCCGVIAML